jgi:hypothetical protein
MDLVKGAALLTELLGEQDPTPVEPSELDSRPPIFRWCGVDKPDEADAE